ncbi:MAG: hypothetical protein HQL11_01340 [Candidatus Omnitrophica bacterium]|nr:hypothetical protein [Candidatus Omnitrophota bacterium]
MRAFEKYFGGLRWTGWERSCLRMLLALHDIGKPRAILEGNKRLQHKFTLEMLTAIEDRLPLDHAAKRLIHALLKHDPVGAYLKNEVGLKEAADVIRESSDGARMPANEYFRYLTVYYQSDVVGYTSEGGIVSALDPLFVWSVPGQTIAFDPSLERLIFSEGIEKKYLELTRELAGEIR